MTKIVIFGNEKGGSGKSTTAMHVMAYLLQKNKKVGIIDLDIRQRSLFRFLENRYAYSDKTGVKLLFPEVGVVKESEYDSKKLAYQEEENLLGFQIESLKSKCDYILIDCPGSNTHFSVCAHNLADLIITPINDSLVDFDLLGKLDTQSKKIKYASIYSEMVWNVRKYRLGLNLPSTKWFVLRNRINHLNSKNKQQLDISLLELSRRVGFEAIPGFSERTIFRELFVLGLTLLDVDVVKDWKLTVSHIAARNEIRSLINRLGMN